MCTLGRHLGMMIVNVGHDSGAGIVERGLYKILWKLPGYLF